MLTTSCPKCEKEVSVPAAACAQSRVRCPLCSQEYTLESVFADLPPLLELLDAPATNGADVAGIGVVDDKPSSDDTVADEPGGGMFDFDQGDADSGAGVDDGGDVAIGDPVESVPTSSGFDFGGDDAAAASVGSTTTTKRPARTRKKASPVKSIIGVIIGGLFALPIAQLTLWYLPGGWDIEQRDPVGIGRTLAGGFASFIVPSWVASPAADGDDPEPEPGTANNDGQDNKPLAPVEEPGELGTLLGSAHDNNDNANSASDGREGNGEGNIVDPFGAGDPDVFGSGEDDNPPPPKPGVKDAPTFTTTDLSAEIKVVNDEVKRFDDVTNQELDGPVRLAIRDDFFRAVGKLAEVTTFVDEKPEGHREFLDEILAEAGDTPEKRKIIGVSALAYVKKADRETGGIIITGVVQEIQQRGQLFEAVIAVEGPDNPRMSIYGDRDPSAAFRKDETVIILGVIIDKPKDELRGYKGPPVPVIWGGYSQVIASP